jgi:tRNA1Val (adenine37-N6)-methyltransferase
MAGGNVFRFKRFAVDHGGCAMKVGTDGVLLGAWCRVEPSKDEAILDVGTGTGVIALQLAQRTEDPDTLSGPMIDAVETNPGACEAARRNFEASPWADRLVLHQIAAQKFVPAEATVTATEASTGEAPTAGTKKYDHIVSNPPWFADSLISPDPARTTARHTRSLSYDDIITLCGRLLKPDGRVSLIVPAGAETAALIAAAAAGGFVPTRRTEVHSTPASGPKRTLLELSRTAGQTPGQVPAVPDQAPGQTHAVPDQAPVATTKLIIQNPAPNTFTDEYRRLTRDFYLYF